MAAQDDREQSETVGRVMNRIMGRDQPTVDVNALIRERNHYYDEAERMRRGWEACADRHNNLLRQAQNVEDHYLEMKAWARKMNAWADRAERILAEHGLVVPKEE